MRSRSPLKILIAHQELNTLLTDKYGEPDTENIVNNNLKAYWYEGNTEIKLSGSFIRILSYKPNMEELYLEPMPKDYNKI